MKRPRQNGLIHLLRAGLLDDVGLGKQFFDALHNLDLLFDWRKFKFKVR